MQEAQVDFCAMVSVSLDAWVLVEKWSSEQNVSRVYVKPHRNHRLNKN